MKNTSIRLTCVAAITTVLSVTAGTAYAFNAAIGVHTGLMGPGLDVTMPIVSQKISARLGFNYLNYSTDGSESGVDYDVDLNLHNAFALVDYYPFGGTFRLTAGSYYNDNSVDLKGRANSGNTFNIGSATFTGAQVGTLSGKVDFNTLSPYFGIGIGNPVGAGSRFTFTVDIGAIYQGSPNASLSASGPIASNSIFQAELAREVSDLESSIDKYKFYPLVQVGLNYRF